MPGRGRERHRQPPDLPIGPSQGGLKRKFRSFIVANVYQAEERRTSIETALANYPNIDADSVEQIKTWFRKEASSLDIALLASDERLAEAYRHFRADHIDRFSAPDLVRGIVFSLVVVLIVTLIVWRAL
jgi:hypothetical protein